jgi:hypothetical protein
MVIHSRGNTKEQRNCSRWWLLSRLRGSYKRQGSNTSTVTLRVVGGDEKESLKSETVKYCRKSQGTRTRERLRWQGPVTHTTDRPVLSSERAPHGNKNVTVRQNKYLVMGPRWGSIPRLTDWLTVSRNMALTLTWVLHSDRLIDWPSVVT